jgi:hypothetical protein
MSTSRPVSERKRAANRANAEKSTGPRTPAGKAKVGRNAIKHGIFARDIVPGILGNVERIAEYEDLLLALHADLQPAEGLESILVESVATAYWRLRRLLRAEAGHIARLQDDVPAEVDRIAHLQDRTSTRAGLDLPGSARDLRRSLDELAALARQCGTGHSQPPAPPPPADDRPRQVAILQSCCSLPRSEELSTLLRYEAQLHRQIHRDLNALERLRRRRQGEAVPPPLAIDIDLGPSSAAGPEAQG